MRALRGDRGWAVTARSLALFALLIQFTLPFGIALAEGLQPGVPSTAVFDCMGGADGDSRLGATGHQCPLPGGCCVGPATVAPRGPQLSNGQAIPAQAVPDTDRSPHRAVSSFLPPSRGPPTFL